MTIATTSSPVDFPGGVKITAGVITFDASYPTAGEAITPAQFGAGAVGVDGRKPDFVLFNVNSPTTSNKLAAYIRATGKIALYGTAISAIGVTESTNTTDHSLTIIDFVAFWINPGATVTDG